MDRRNAIKRIIAGITGSMLAPIAKDGSGLAFGVLATECQYKHRKTSTLPIKEPNWVELKQQLYEEHLANAIERGCTWPQVSATIMTEQDMEVYIAMYDFSL